MPGRQVLLVYDHDCPVCRNYCQAARIRAAAGELQLVNARESGKILQEITARGLDIDRGMVLKLGDRYYHGADAIHVLALLSTRSGLFNRLNNRLFRSARLARVLYPLLRSLRNLLLKLLGRRRINNLGRPGNDRF